MDERKETKRKEMTVGRAVVGFAVPILVMIGLVLFTGADLAIAFLIAVFLLVGFGIYMGYTYDELDKAMSSGIGQVASAIVVMLLVGCMVSSWMASGSIPAMLYYALQFISPQLYLPLCFILPAFMAVCTGTSWGSISTIGVILCGMSAGLGIPLPMAAGAVISGAFFGDKMSPLSDTNLLTVATTGVTVFEHIVSMFYTTIPATVISLILYTALGLRASGNIDTAAINEMAEGLLSSFHISVWNLIPVILVLVLSVKRVPAFITFGAGIGSGVLWAIFVQGYSFTDSMGFLLSGFSIDSGVEAVNTLVNRGGLSSMLSLGATMIFCGMLSGLFTEMKILIVLVNGITKKVHTPGGIMVGVILSAVILSLAAGQYPAIAITGIAFKDACDEMDIHRAVLSRTLGDVGTMTSALVPWNVWTAGYGVLLGTSVVSFIPYVFLCSLSIIIALINNLTGIGLFRRSDEVKYHLYWRRKKTAEN